MHFYIFILALAIITGCSSSFLKKDEEFAHHQTKEFEDVVKIEKTEVLPTVFPAPPLEEIPPTLTPTPTPEKITPTPTPKKKKGKTPEPTPTTDNKIAEEEEKAPLPHEPDIESPIGFNGRRPLKDPFRVGEKVVHEVSYFKVTAGELALEVGGMPKVNGKKSYNFITNVKSSDVFSMFYSVNDTAETFVDYESMTPSVYTLKVTESKQMRDAKAYFDPIKLVATFWESKISKSSGKEEKKLQWNILPYSQNVYSAAFYMRLFTYEVGKEYAFRVANDGENIVFRGKAIRKEQLKTEVGTFDTIILKVDIEVEGIFKPVGDVYFWLSNDDRKYILKIVSEIKIGSIVSQVIKLDPGKAIP